jgi:hypothetical protein
MSWITDFQIKNIKPKAKPFRATGRGLFSCIVGTSNFAIPPGYFSALLTH